MIFCCLAFDLLKQFELEFARFPHCASGYCAVPQQFARMGAFDERKLIRFHQFFSHSLPPERVLLFNMLHAYFTPIVRGRFTRCAICPQFGLEPSQEPTLEE